MKINRLLEIINRLTGKPVRFPRLKEQKTRFIAHLRRLINRKNIIFDWNELNELLLICNKDRILSRDFFDFFFKKNKRRKKKINIDELEQGVENFRKYAMLAFGNFIYAYKKLSKLNYKGIRRELRDYLGEPKKKEAEFKSRPAELEDIYPIDKKYTYFVGHLSGRTIVSEWRATRLLQKFMKQWKGQFKKIDSDLVKYLNRLNKRGVDRSIPLHIVEKYHALNSRTSVNDFNKFIGNSLSSIGLKRREFMNIRERATMNTEIYLTWDYIDVYLATSMRKKYEFENCYDFAQKLFNTERLRKLRVRYFDPTQSFENNRIDKGLIEGLMLKRAKCTIYSVQETDTLGKDSELAVTLAQGKPVIAYIPEIDVRRHVNFIKKQSLLFLRDKIDLLCEMLRDPQIQNLCWRWLKKSGFRTDIKDTNSFNKFILDQSTRISSIYSNRIWESIELTNIEERKFKKQLGKDFEIICNFVAIADEKFYNKRADTLKKEHPLGIQVNLSNGVANGVLLVRNIENCSKLLYNVLTNKLKFKIHFDRDLKYWFLEESISKCVFRVVTENQKLTNSFWNFYLLGKEEEENGE